MEVSYSYMTSKIRHCAIYFCDTETALCERQDFTAAHLSSVQVMGILNKRLRHCYSKDRRRDASE